MSTFMDRDDPGLAQWLDAEADGRLEDADALFLDLVARHVPPLSPPVGFAAATVSRALVLTTAAWPWWVRGLIAASIALAGIPLAWLEGFSLFDLVAASGTRLAPLFANLVSISGAAASLAVSTWRLAVPIGQAVLTACATGPGPLIIVTNLTLALVGFLGLRRLLATPKESW